MEPDRKKPAAAPHRLADFVSLACVAAAVLCGASASAAERPDETDYLFRVSLPANAVDVFLPAREIGTREEAAAYLDWARRTHAGSKGEIRAVWDDEPVDVALPKNSNLRTNLLAFVRDGDSAVDPSGFNAFTVTNADAATGAFQLVLAGGREPDGTRAPLDPRVCLTNVWVLPRRELFARWDREAPTNAAGVRAEIAALRDSGLFRLSVGRGKAWETAVDAYVRGNRDLRPKIRFWNRSGVPVLLSFDGKDVVRVSPDDSFDFVPPAEDARTSFPWRARRADLESATDADYKWDEGDIAWSAAATEDAAKTFFDPPGRLKAEPYFDLPREAVPDELGDGRAKAFARYAGEEEVAVELERSGGTLRFKARPHRKLESLRISGPSGWKDGTLRPKGLAELAYGDTGELVLESPMQPPPKPWPAVEFRNRFVDPVRLEIAAGGSVHVTTNVYVGAPVRIDFDRVLSGSGEKAVVLRCTARAGRAKATWERKLDLRRGGAEETFEIEMEKASVPKPPIAATRKATVEATANVEPTASPADHPWPRSKEVAALWNFLHRTDVRVVTTEGTRPVGSLKETKRTLANWQSFWSFSLSLDEKTLRSVVAHIAVCPKGCDRCMASRAKTIPDNDGLLPKEEAFLALGGWHVERQGRFCRESAEENHWKYDWDDFEDDRQGWIAFVSKQSDRPGEKATENLKSFWTGENENGRAFANLYRSVELGTLPDRRFDGILRLPTFEERRRELFRQVMAGGESPRSTAEVEGWIQKLDESAGVTQ